MCATPWAGLGCAQILGADFDGLTRGDEGTGGTSSGGATTTGGSGGTTTGGASAGGAGGAGGIATDAGGGAASTGGSGAIDGAVDGASTGGGSSTGGSGATGGSPATGGALATGGAASGGAPATGGALATGGFVATGGSAATGGYTGTIVNGVVLNEVRNTSGDYIELYNTDDAPFDLGGYALTDQGNGGNPDTAGKESFPSGTIIPPHGFVLVLSNQLQPISAGTTSNCAGLSTPCYHATFGISQSGENVFLLDPSSGTKDSTTVPGNLSASVSWGRYPDGTGSFGYTIATPKSPNQL